MLSTSNVLLRPWRDTDLSALCDLRNDVMLQRNMMSRARGSSLDATRDWLKRRTAEHYGVLLIIASPGDEETVRGFIQLTAADAISGSAMLGICVSPSWHGTEVAADALALVAQHARDVLCLRKIVLEVLTTNDRAVAFYLKHDFREVGVLRNHFLWAGEWLDVTVMERLLV